MADTRCPVCADFLDTDSGLCRANCYHNHRRQYLAQDALQKQPARLRALQVQFDG